MEIFVFYSQIAPELIFALKDGNGLPEFVEIDKVMVGGHC